MLSGKNLRVIDHAVAAAGQADAGELEITFDISPVAGAVEPAVHYFAGGHLSGGNILRYQGDGAHFLVEVGGSVIESAMSEGSFTGGHVLTV